MASEVLTSRSVRPASGRPGSLVVHSPPPSADAPAVVDAPVSGLCTTCVRAPECVLRLRSPGGVQRCEEFVPGESAATHLLVLRTGQEVPDAPPGAARRLGLCANCIHNETCKLPRSAGGVWHCEAYE